MKIYDSIKIKNVLFQNRIVMAPMVPFGLPVNQDGTMGKELINHYLQRTSNSMGLMISQSLCVTPSPLTGKTLIDGGVGIYSDNHKVYLNQLVEACHRRGTIFFAQLAYPSIGYHNGDSITELTETDIEAIKNEFVHAAKLCKESGCDGIELHGANGFFLNMFACPLSNNRGDQYGGNINGRLLLAKKIVKEIQAFADDNFIISYRMGWNDNLENDIQTAQALEQIGIDLLHVSFGIPSKRKIKAPENFPYNSIVYTGTQVKKHIHIPVIVVNDIRTLRRGNILIKNDACDFVAFGKPFLADKEFLTKSLSNYDFNPCLGCKNCQWFRNGEKCPARIKTELSLRHTKRMEE